MISQPLLLTLLPNVDSSQRTRLWWILITAVVFSVSFGFCAYGLWRFRGWARQLFLATIAIWSAINLIAAFLPDAFYIADRNYSYQTYVILVAQHGLGFLLPLWYLNLPHIKALFK